MFDWDTGNLNHIALHGVSRVEAEQAVLNDPIDLQFQDGTGEERVVQVGETNAGRILVVVTTMRDHLIRVVTAFPAKRRIRKVYLAQRKSIHEGGTEETELQE
ncbi:MAG: BrnT family toxin [Terracidiphilus sp.]